MNLKDAFQELDNLHEESEYLNRQNIINNIKATGYTCNFDRFSTKQLASMLPRLITKTRIRKSATEPIKVPTTLATNNNTAKYCSICNALLSDNGECAKCSSSGLGDNYDGDYLQ